MDLIILNLEIIKDFKKKITKKTAAIMVETVMGEGGIKVIPRLVFKRIKKNL